MRRLKTQHWFPEQGVKLIRAAAQRNGGRIGFRELLTGLVHGAPALVSEPALAELREKLPVPAEAGEQAVDPEPAVLEVCGKVSDAILARGPAAYLSELLRHAGMREFVTSLGLDPEALRTRLTPDAAATAPEPQGADEDVLRHLRSVGLLLTDVNAPNRLFGDPYAPPRLLGALTRQLLVPRMRNVILAGPSGVGKSGLIHALADRIRRRGSDVPAPLAHTHLLEVTGAEHVQRALDAVRNRPDIVLFIDRLYQVLAVLAGVFNYRAAFDQLLRALEAGEASVVGCATPEDVSQIRNIDSVLLRRFRVLHVTPPAPDETEAILSRRRGRLEKHFSLQVPEGLVRAAVDLAQTGLPNRVQPEKSNRLLEMACAHAAVGGDKTLESKHLEAALIDLQGGSVVPAAPTTLKVEEVQSRLKSVIVGQDHVLDRLADLFVAARVESRWAALERGPRGVFLFAGPTGVGKTETAVQMSRLLGGGRDALVRVDCQNMQGGGTGHEAHTYIWRLLGVAPGYVGHQPGCRDGLLVRVREFPECVLLLDEFEKADTSVGQLLLRILDEGKAQDSEGQELDFRRCFVILTTNAGVSYDESKVTDIFRGKTAPPPAASEERLENELLRTGLGPEFLARVRHRLYFRGLEAEDFVEVLRRERDQIAQSADRLGVTFQCDDAVLRAWVRHLELARGARTAQIEFTRRILDSLRLADSGPPEVRTVVVRATDGEQRGGPASPRVEPERDGETLTLRVSWTN